MRRCLRAGRRLLAVPLLIGGLLAGGVPAIAASPALDVTLVETPNSVASADDGSLVASLRDAGAVALVSAQGAVRQVPLECSPADVAVSPDGQTAWAVCQDSLHLNVIDVAEGSVSRASLEVEGMDDVVYLPDADSLIVASLTGRIVTVERVLEGAYEVTDQGVVPDRALSSLAPLADGSGTYAVTDYGDLLFVDLEMAGQVVEIIAGSSQRYVLAAALSPDQTRLYVAVVNYADPDNVVTSVQSVDRATLRTRHSVVLGFTNPGATTVELAVAHRRVYIASGFGVEIGDLDTGMLFLPVAKDGRLGALGAAVSLPASGAAVSVSPGYGRVGFGTTNATVVGLADPAPAYPKAIGVAARAEGGTLTVSGTTTSMTPGTVLRVYAKDLTSSRSRVVLLKPATVVLVNGRYSWSGAAPSKRFELHVRGGGVRSATVTVRAR